MLRQTALRDAVAEIQESLERRAKYSLGKVLSELSTTEWFTAVALSVRDRLVDRMLETKERYRKSDPKRLHYLSIEFLLGRLLDNNLQNLGIRDLYRQVLRELGADLDEIEALEEDAALGNGGLGRLAACFLDSLATQAMAGYGYGINYEYGLFRQEIDNGYQREKPDNWLVQGTPWEIARPEDACIVPIYGRIEHALADRTGGYNPMWMDDAIVAGKELRLVQEYFLVACAIRDITRAFEQSHADFREFPAKVAIQLNDTHPALAVAELMRLLVDEKELAWEEAWDITQATLGCTNHTLASEALEKWPVPMLETVLPRHLQIIYEINQRFLKRVAVLYPGDLDRQSRMSLIEESAPKQVRMTHLAILGSHSVNGVSAIHTSLVKTVLAPDFFQLWPDRFQNKTNGISPRRWLLNANPALADLLRATIGEAWITELERLRELEKWVDDGGWRAEFLKVKQANKEKLARIIREDLHIRVDPASLFDVQVKRIHAYKRQLLNVMHIMDEYLSLIEDGRRPLVPHTYVFAGKAAPGYWFAKQIIKLIHNVARVVNNDSRASQWMKVVFLADYRVSLAEMIIPAADLSEQISTAGTEASGTSNMKLALNGAVTIGTLDGANIEILEEVGHENIFIFGLKTAEVQSLRQRRAYQPWRSYDGDARVKRVVDAFRSNLFSPAEPELFAWIFQILLDPNDAYFHLADLPAYLGAHEQAGIAFRDRERWARMSVLNVARMGQFSIDRTVAEYARDIWNIKPARRG
jgi:glycogen phosphorylase